MTIITVTLYTHLGYIKLSDKGHSIFSVHHAHCWFSDFALSFFITPYEAAQE